MAHRSEFELMGKVGIGQYIPTGSVVHRLDARMKLLLGTLIIGVTIFVSSITALLLLFVIVLFGLLLSKVQVRLAFISMRRVLPYLFILAAIQMLAVPQFRLDAAVLWEWKFFVLTDRSLMSGLLLIGRFIERPCLTTILEPVSPCRSFPAKGRYWEPLLPIPPITIGLLTEKSN